SPVRGLGVGHYGCWNEAAVFRGRGTAGRACRRTGAGVGFGARSGRPRWLPPVWPAVGGAGPGVRGACPPAGRGGRRAAGHRMALMQAAAREFGVPAGLLLAISYDQTRWDRPGGSPSVDGGFGLMDLTASTSPPADGRGDPAQPAPRKVTLPRTHFTLDEAARL